MIITQEVGMSKRYDKNVMIKVNVKGGEAEYHTAPAKEADQFAGWLQKQATVESVEVFKCGEMPLESLPESAKQEAIKMLKKAHRIEVAFTYGIFRAHDCRAIFKEYPNDWFIAGEYKA